MIDSYAALSARAVVVAQDVAVAEFVEIYVVITVRTAGVVAHVVAAGIVEIHAVSIAPEVVVDQGAAVGIVEI